MHSLLTDSITCTHGMTKLFWTGAMLAEYQKVTSLLTYLQAMRGRRLWHYEDVSLTHINLQRCPPLS